MPKQWQRNAGWGVLAVIGVILIVVGIRGTFGSLLAVVVAPDQMLTPDTQGTDQGGENPPPSSDNAAAA